MSVYVIGDLHLSFSQDKPMNIFGEIWENHTGKIKKDWEEKVKKEDTVFLLGDFSWAMKLKDTLQDFEYINSMPGKKILLKGNHDYWWTTVTNMKKFLEENNIKNIDFLFNNAFEIENKVFCGTRAWAEGTSEEDEENQKIIERECGRLKFSIEYGIQNFGKDKEFIACLHYPPITKSDIDKGETTPFMEILKQYKIKRCYYGHLHGDAIKDAIEGTIDGIELKLISADGVDFKLKKVE